MAELHPDVTFIRPRSKTKQIGSQHSHEKEYGKAPRHVKLTEYEYVASHDSTVNAVFQIFADTIISLLGPLEHPDPEIDDYLKYNSSRLTDDLGVDVSSVMSQIVIDALTTGLSVSENLYEVQNGRLYLRDFCNYNSKSIKVITNKHGRLTENEDSNKPGKKSGVYQTGNYFSSYLSAKPDTRLPLWKINFINHRRRHGNYYGKSAIEPIYKWCLSTDAIADMMLTALHRFGTPLSAFLVPIFQTDQQEIDPETGTAKNLSTLEVLKRELENGEAEGGSSILLPYLSKDMKPDVKNLTTGNNVGTTFLDTISFCDVQKVRGLLFPFALLGSSKTYATDNESQSERQMEIFHRVVLSMYREMIIPYTSHSWHRLIRMTFNRESAKVPPSFPLRRTSRPEERVALMQLIAGLTERGYLNPTNEYDWDMVRDWVSANKRKYDEKDESFINSMLFSSPTPPGESASKPEEEKEKSEKSEDEDEESEEKKEKPKTRKAKPGRPIGSSKPQQVSRPLKGSESKKQKALLT